MLWLMLFACRQTMLSPAPIPQQDPSKEYRQWLKTVVDERGYIDYQAAAANRGPLDRYVAWMSNDKFSTQKKARGSEVNTLNAINALTILQVINRGMPESVLDVGWWPGEGAGFYEQTQFDVGPDMLSLSELIHERLRWMKMDYRVHAAINWGQASGPPVAADLYRPKSLNSQLDAQMSRWLMDSERGVRFAGGEAVFNPLFDTYARDFSFLSRRKSLCEIAATYTFGRTQQQLKDLEDEGCPHSFFEADTSLNASR